MIIFSLKEVHLPVRNLETARRALSELGFNTVSTAVKDEKSVLMRLDSQPYSTAVRLFTPPEGAETPKGFWGTLTVEPGTDLELAIRSATKTHALVVAVPPTPSPLGGGSFAVLVEPVSGLSIHLVRRIF